MQLFNLLLSVVLILPFVACVQKRAAEPLSVSKNSSTENSLYVRFVCDAGLEVREKSFNTLSEFSPAPGEKVVLTGHQRYLHRGSEKIDFRYVKFVSTGKKAWIGAADLKISSCSNI